MRRLSLTKSKIQQIYIPPSISTGCTFTSNCGQLHKYCLLYECSESASSSSGFATTDVKRMSKRIICRLSVIRSAKRMDAYYRYCCELYHYRFPQIRESEFMRKLKFAVE